MTKKNKNRFLDRELRTIYEEGDDLQKITRGSGRYRFVAVLALFFAFLAAVAWAGFFVFKPYARFSGSGIKLEIDGPAELTSGDEVTYIIRYENGENVPLANAEISILTSRGFSLQSAMPAPAEQGAWKLGSLEKGGKGEIALKGFVAEGVGGVITVQAVLAYTPANFNSEFQRVSTKSSKVEDSRIKLSLVGPIQILPGDEGLWTIEYENGGLAVVPQAELRFKPSAKFLFKKANPAPAKESTEHIVWTFENLAPGAKGKITIRGTFASEATGMETEFAAFGLIDAEGAFLLQKEISTTSEIKQGDIVLTLVVNGGGGDRAEVLGSDLRYSLTVSNRSDEIISNVEPAIIFSPKPEVAHPTSLIKWQESEIARDGERSGNRVVWTKKSVPELAKLSSGEEIIFDVRLPITDKLLPVNDRNYSVTAWAEAKIGGQVSRTVQSKLIIVKITSDLKLSAEARYFNDDNIALGFGPIPPKVGQTTAYRIFWTVSNSLHEIKGLTVTARLPEDVVWQEKFRVDRGEMVWDEKTRTVEWKMESLPLSVQTVRADFEVAVTPDAEDAGRTLTLVEPATIEGKDEVTETLVFQTTSAITSDIENDPEAAGKGKVEW